MIVELHNILEREGIITFMATPYKDTLGDELRRLEN